MLREKVVERTQSARASGHLESIPTTAATFMRHGVRWVIRMAPHLVKKKKEATRPASNPFLPYEPEMFVADASDTHAVLLNKFNVVEHHLVIVTRRFEHQRTLLTRSDFAATSLVLRELGGLAFYNAGRAAGASQPHKHVQVVPRVDPELEGVPIEPLLGALPFLHATAQLDEQSDLWEVYRSLLQSVSADPRITSASAVETSDTAPEGPGERQPFPYDLLLTRSWMLLVPRTRESSGGIQVNSLGYAGAFLAKTDDERRRIEQDPLEVLAQAGVR
jgi:sulfate adenylyltransferase (ADP) / ATP adenylyltransferase